MELKILGTKYDFAGATAKEDSGLHNCGGYCDFYGKLIRYDTDCNENAPNAVADFAAADAKIKRHEIVHAFYFESGMDGWARDEALVDWLAVQFPKILKVFQEAGCI